MPAGFGLEPKLSVAYGEYDFSKDGGAIGDIALRGSIVPKDAIIVGGFLYVNAACTSDGAATIALKTEGAADILAATPVATFALNAIIAVVPVFTAATMKRMTDNRYIVASIAAFALTAGKFVVVLYYNQVKP
jgi:hypothetical protein